ncbi:tRNA adenosine(34) deaminase TadA [Kangiella profundi]|uniref:tRNA-specific adenosine deaminase n=1 Tax=Kangiella profundi TaxID=1561924 RepID=A0A2K9A618_9GAMM|nr:tRNA adenosine(34) deaminase TadA [Kangiella profundi]AUD79285.1 tRNA adenosine(34) deaminase TadA [Kangiella profundi]GGE99866.1 tRNA-specific adenosine deaminase [Kangiella profundi]
MTDFTDFDQQCMHRAFELAAIAEEKGEVPVGAVLAKDGEVIAEGFNQPILSHDPTAHAEVVALRAAGEKIENYRLVNTTLYVTLEPCAMCAMAMVHARVSRVVFATSDPRTGAAGSVLNILQNPSFNHQCVTESGLMQEQCSEQLKSFFRNKRNSSDKK